MSAGVPSVKTLSQVVLLVSCTAWQDGTCTLPMPSSLSRLLTHASWTYSLEMLHRSRFAFSMQALVLCATGLAFQALCEQLDR